eukprot:GFUD01036173.1.p1 GENE.GFUD01036173.1~~GFUD01036173.1.p1  ORF type:complete len:297 (+),score=103.39 GFUD01036173.1:157-1047(+)
MDTVRSRLVTEKTRLDVERTKLARLSNQGEREEEVKEIEKVTTNDSANRFDFIFKIVIIGDATCGKTSLMKRYVEDLFHCQTLTTIGVDFNVKTVVVDGSTIKLQIWDTAGQERFAPLGGLYYHGAHAVIIAYDVSNKKTFENVQKWNNKFDDRDTEDINTVKVLVGCKSDLEDMREISSDTGKTQAIQIGARWAETSSKTGNNVEMLFEEVAKAILERRKMSVRQDSDMSAKSEKLESGVEILTPNEEMTDNETGGPFQILKSISTRKKTQRKKKENKITDLNQRKQSSKCCQIS